MLRTGGIDLVPLLKTPAGMGRNKKLSLTEPYIATYMYETSTGWTLYKPTSLTKCLRLSPSPKS